MIHLQQIVRHAKSFYWARREHPLAWRTMHRAICGNKVLSATSDFLCYATTGNAHFGSCPICDGKMVFLILDRWLRDNYRCVRCNSIPRFRHVAEVLRKTSPDFPKLTTHESSPHGSLFEKLKREVPGYLPTHYWPGLPNGSYRDGIRSENLGAQTFQDATFDLVITQDVLEHVFNPGRGFTGIARTRKPGGAHIFTIPWYAPKATFVRAAPAAGGIEYLAERSYHGNPIDESGALVVTEWGVDLPEFIFGHGGLITAIFVTRDWAMGLAGDFLEVFVSRKLA